MDEMIPVQNNLKKNSIFFNQYDYTLNYCYYRYLL